MARTSWLLALLIALLIALCAPALCAAETPVAPTLPDPFGLGPRLALIDYLENTLHASVAPGASYDDLVASYWSLVDKPKSDAQAAKRDHIEQMQFILKADFGVDASQISDEDALSARIKQCESEATIRVTETPPRRCDRAAGAGAGSRSRARGPAVRPGTAGRPFLRRGLCR